MAKIKTEKIKGRDIVINSSLEEKLVNLKIYGECKQETTITNLWENAEYIISGFENDVEINGTSISFKRSENNTSPVYIYINTPVINGQTYRFDADIIRDGEWSVELAVYPNTLGNNENYPSSGSTNNITVTANHTKTYMFAVSISSTCNECSLSNISLRLVGDYPTENPVVSPGIKNPSDIIETGTYNPETNKYDITININNTTGTNNLIISLDEPLRGLPNGVSDILYIQNDIAYVDRKVGSMVFAEGNTYTWDWYTREYDYGTSQVKRISYGHSLEDDSMAAGLNNAISSHFSYIPFNSYINSGSDEAFVGAFTTFETRGDKSFISDIKNTTEFETFLIQNKVKLVYELAEQTTETIGAVTLPTMAIGENTITVDTTINPIVEVEYVKSLVYFDISKEDKSALHSGNCAIKTKIIVSPGTEEEIILTEENAVKSWEHVDERYVPDVGFIGQFVARELTGELHNISDDFSLDNKAIELQMAILRTVEDTQEIIETWYSLGTFVVMEPEDDEVRDNTTFDAMDLTTLFNKEFDPTYTSETFTKSFNDTLGEKGSFTAFKLAKYTCEQVGVELANDSFTNADFVISSNQFEVQDTCRDVMKAISQLAFGWCRIGWDNKCYIDEFDLTSTVSDENTITNNQYYSLSTKKVPYGPVNNVYIGMYNVTGGGIEVKDEASVEQYGETCINVFDNPLTNTDELRELLRESAKKLWGLTFTTFETETIGHPWMLTKNPIKIVDMENNVRNTYPFSTTIKYSGHIKTEIKTEAPSKQEEQVGYDKNAYREYKNTKLIVDKQAGTITSLNESVTTVTSDLADNYYTKTQVNKQVNDAVNGITNTYTTGGGNNRLKNTGLYFKDDDNYDDGLVHKYEYWTGDVDVATDLNSASQTAMILKDNRLSQLVDGVPNNKYTISFKYEKLSELAIATVSINSIVYTLGDDGTFAQTFDVGANSIEVIFDCDVPSGYKIYELMCNVGTEPLVWTQHPDEMRTDTVNISKGITITSTATAAIFKAGASGIRIENKSKNTTTEFLENGMVTNNAEIKDQAKITGSLFTKIGRQTWINGL